MTQFNNATFSVGGRHCNGCSQRDVWLEQREDRVRKLEAALQRIAVNDLGEGGGKSVAREALLP